MRLWFRWRIQGMQHLPQRGPALVAATHVSYLDPLVYGNVIDRAGRRPRYLAKRELFGVPVLGRAMKGSKQIPVERGTGDQRPLHLAEDALRAGEVVVVFPEGTVTKRTDGLPMVAKTGTVRLAMATGVPITPMASWGSAAVWQKSGKGSLRFGRPVWVAVGPPIDLSAYAGQEEDHELVRGLTAELMERLTAMAIDLRDRYPREWTRK